LTDQAARPSRRELREFGLVTGSLFAGLFGAVLPLVKHHRPPIWPWVACAVLVIPALAWPPALRPLHFAWQWLGRLLGWINQRIILTLLFYVVVVPTGLVMRLLGRDPMRRRIDPGAQTYRVPSRKQPERAMEKPF
jgi:hypothetical protein